MDFRKWCIRILPSKYPNMLDEDRFFGHNMGSGPTCLEEGRIGPMLEELDLVEADVEMALDQAGTNVAARAYLAETDWYISRQAETGTPIPDDVLANRQAARDIIV